MVKVLLLQVITETTCYPSMRCLRLSKKTVACSQEHGGNPKIYGKRWMVTLPMICGLSILLTQATKTQCDDRRAYGIFVYFHPALPLSLETRFSPELDRISKRDLPRDATRQEKRVDECGDFYLKSWKWPVGNQWIWGKHFVQVIQRCFSENIRIWFEGSEWWAYSSCSKDTSVFHAWARDSSRTFLN